MTQTARLTTVGDRMAVEPIVVRTEATLTEAAALMDHHRLVVVDDADETMPIGLLSMTDLIHAIVEETAGA